MISKITTTHRVNFTQEIDQTTNRSLNTTYQNTTGKTMLVNVEVDGTPNPGQSTGVTGATDAGNPPTTEVAMSLESVNSLTRFIDTITFIVLPGYFYTANVQGVAGLRKWIEWT